MNCNKLTELDIKLSNFAKNNDLTYVIEQKSNKTENSFFEVNINSIISKIIKGDHIKVISKDCIKKNISGYLIDCIVIDKNEFNMVICVPMMSYKKYMTLSSNDYDFYFKHRVLKKISKRDLFLSMLNNKNN